MEIRDYLGSNIRGLEIQDKPIILERKGHDLLQRGEEFFQIE